MILFRILLISLTKLMQVNFRLQQSLGRLDEWSSPSSLAIISMIDDEYDVVINGNDLRNCNTIEDLFAIVESKK